ncbi:hypothetical protein PF003_g29711 [Phytophthora fragariae]|nr:hypothetical protein PF003_g29711 [Phytophthora fragariae]
MLTPRPDSVREKKLRARHGHVWLITRSLLLTRS